MSKQILVVDDEIALARMLQVQLERKGYQVRLAYNGGQALAAVAVEHPDLIVLDVIMPGIDGFEVLRRLKADPETADIPVMMLTARAEEASVFRGWAEGVHGYMTKPFDPNDLIVFVERLLAGDDFEDDLLGVEDEAG